MQTWMVGITDVLIVNIISMCDQCMQCLIHVGDTCNGHVCTPDMLTCCNFMPACDMCIHNVVMVSGVMN